MVQCGEEYGRWLALVRQLATTHGVEAAWKGELRRTMKWMWFTLHTPAVSNARTSDPLERVVVDRPPGVCPFAAITSAHGHFTP
ncbi:hypothetical protein [Streptomyces sp. AV19]|uniref:hypothetical protein n=1 Tax=Streptomyces sp. AV19 TaxID=2793068 RepID=UPI0024132179|nr:hypothetical protein [Streptomyces sp. AV19]MDG4534056.1 hypothetical protein [Streptomyces sp. AV19]